MFAKVCRSLNLVGFVAALAMVSQAATSIAADITGAGATFPYAVYTKWAEAYQNATGSRINYQGIGSAGGIKQIKSKTVDFGGTDVPLHRAELRASGLVQFPSVVGAVTLVVNLPGVKSGDLKLDGSTAARIFSGSITKWDDPAIKDLNPSLDLPSLSITIAHRSDGSGTTFVFSKYLAKQSAAFQRTVGFGTTVNWPVNSVGGKGNPGVAASVQSIKGAIGYVDIADATKNNMVFVALKNKAGNFVLPSRESVAEALANANFREKGMAPDLLDQRNKNAWPITSATYILAYEKGSDAEKQKAVVDFFKWSLNNGQSMAEELGFVPLPTEVVRLVEAELIRLN